MIDENFISPKLTRHNLDRYLIRTCIFNFLKRNSSQLTGTLLDVGCGKMPYKKFLMDNSTMTSYTGLDINSAIIYDAHVKPDFTWDGIKMPFENNSYENALATEVLEHCPNPSIILKEIIRVLKPGGKFLFTVPFLWNLHETPNDEYRYTPFALSRLLTEAGFTNIKLEAQGGWHASMAQMLGLWVCRAPISEKWRTFLKFLIFPFYKFLLKKEIHPKTITDGLMITGLTGVAFKP
ncbi:class I SAM-dependent methyltransferase [Pedobacter aquae]|uniref:Class I SAM-dependent methyltransferase n=1 Tax=Pedobacter aquae TaxID=2605747 RepID=A0A5C0VC49_9SPHI|nr:class I SAM-dependent methyltransferase [Pedobacter aquae]QEK50335.1 class I SAM-dependent methyltransferase [Pedobacter aquae]